MADPNTAPVPASTGKPAAPSANQPAQQRAQKNQQEHAAAVSGAESVADAVKRVADAAVQAAAQGKPLDKGDFFFSGTIGGRFEIRGEGFGPSGIVKVNGVQARARMWSTRWITGDLPANVGYGDVEVIVDDQTTRRGYFRAPAI